MKDLIIEWKHYDKKGNTCDRCSKTGSSLRKVIKDLKGKLRVRGIRVSFKETKLSENGIQESNTILFNNVPLEDLFENMKIVNTPCNSCCELIGSQIDCRALSCQGQITENISAKLIKKAAKSFLLRKEEK